MDIDEKITEKNRLLKEAREINDKKELTTEDQEKFNKLMNRYDEITEDLARAKRVEDAEQEMANTVKPKISALSQKYPGKSVSELRASKEYETAFNNWVRDPRNPELHNALSTSPDTAGGFVTPESWDTNLVQQMEYGNPMLMLAKRITTSSTLHIPLEASRAEAAWTAENAAYNEDDAVFGEILLGAHKITVLTKVSEELLQDSFINIPSYLTESFGLELGKKVEEALIRGTGTGQPTGVLSGATAVAGVAGSVTDTQFFDLYYSLKPGYRNSASWLMHTDIIKAARMLKDANGQYLYITSGIASIPDSILGRSVYESEFMDATLGAGDEPMMLGDYTNYTIADRRPFNVKVLNELFATNGQTGYQAMLRIDGNTIRGEGISKLLLA